MKRLFTPFASFALLSSAAFGALTAPVKLEVQPLGVNAFRLKWNDRSDNEIGWEIRVGLKGSTPQRLSLLPAQNLESYTVILNELPGAELVFQVAAYNGPAGAEVISAPTKVVTARAFPKSTFERPLLFKASPAGDGRIRFTWKDRSTSEVGYQIQLRARGAKTWSELGTVEANSKFRIPATGFAPDTAYSFRIRAYKGNPTVFTPWSNVAKVATSSLLAPSALKAIAHPAGKFSFAWKDRSTAETGFELQSREGDGPFVAQGTVAANTVSTAPIGNFTKNANFQFRLRTIRTSNGITIYSGFSNVVSIRSTAE